MRSLRTAAAAMFLAPLWVVLFLGVPRTASAQATTAPSPIAPPPSPAPERVRDSAGRVAGPARAGWWNEGVCYELFVRSFKDSAEGPLAGDGVGDLPGLISKLDYLNDGKPGGDDLGVTALWLMPIHPSPSYHGYDITDYYGINKDYGTLDDFRTLVRECHRRGVKVVIDLVLNHCSDQHPWFVEAADAASPRHGWFIWADKDPGWKGPWGQTVWHRLRRGGGTEGGPPCFYYGLFSPRMPDLNYRSPEVSDQMLDVVRYWLREPPADGPGAPGGSPPGVGVDGLRLDAIRHLVEDGQVQENTPGTRAWLRTFRRVCKETRPDSMSIGEVWAGSDVAASYVGDQLDLAFEFDLSAAMIDSLLGGNADRVRDAQEKVLRLYPPNQYGRFLTNHDQPRVMTRLKGNEGAMRAAAAMLLLGPGVPFMYYGEELGLTGDKPDERLRTPMPWTGGPGAGFSAHKPWQALAPDSGRVNVERESRDPGSLLSWYRRLIALRLSTPALAYGTVQHLTASDPGVYAFLRHDPGTEGDAAHAAVPASAVLVVVNVGGKPLEGVRVWSDGSPLRGTLHAAEALGGEPAPDVDAAGPRGAIGRYAVGRLPAYGVRAYVLTVGGAR
jgi:glycosidase